jgi:hypothetical protein
MKLYAWQPHGHGELSFFVVAESEEEARRHVEEHIRLSGVSSCDYQGWGTDYYQLTVAEPGMVLRNFND